MATSSAQAPPAQVVSDPIDQQAGIRILQRSAAFVACGYAAYGLVAAPVIIDSTSVMHDWWTILAVGAIFVPGLTLGIFARRLSAAELRRLAAVAVAGYLVAAATWYFGWDGHDVNTTTGIWFSMFFGVVGLAGSLAFRARIAFALLVVVATASMVVNHLIRPPELNQSLIPDLAWAIGFSLIYVAAGTMLSTTAELLDSTRTDAYNAAADAAATRARSAERGRFDALTHDSVMATLLLAGRHGQSRELAQHARMALEAIDRAATENLDSAVAITTLEEQLTAAVALIDPTVAVQFAGLDAVVAPVPVPGTVASAMTTAAAEAVRNSVRHAGPDATISVVGTATSRALTVEIIDDGRGFDPDLVAAARFGLAVSIRGQLSRVANGAASVTSAPGEGTRVKLEWHR